MADRKLVFKVSDVPMMELSDGRFRDVFQITDQTCGPDTKLSAGVVWLSPHNDAGHMDIHGSGRWHGVIAPDFVEKLVSCQGRAPMLDEMTQELEFLGGQFDRLAVFFDLGAPEVHAHGAEPVTVIRTRDAEGRAAQ